MGPGRLTFVAIFVVAAVLLMVVVVTGDGPPRGGEGIREVAEEFTRPEVQLREGPAVLLVRHALTDTSRSDADPTARGGCDQQRLLSAEGVAQAEQIGRSWERSGMPVSRVLASPFCRTLDTAEAIAAAFDLEAEPTDSLLSLTAALDADGVRRLEEDMRALVGDALAGDGWVVMVTHTQNIESLTGELVDEGGAVLLAPDDEPGEFAVVIRYPPPGPPPAGS